MRYLFCICLAVLLFLFQRPSLSSEEILRFPVTDWQPFSIGKEPPYAGIDVDVARVIAQRMQLTLELYACPFKRCLKQIEVGTLDMMSGVAFNEERATYMDYIRETPYGQVSVAFYVRTGQADQVSSYEDLGKHTIGMVRGSHYFERFNSDEMLRKYKAPTEAFLLPMLAGGRLGVIIGTNPNLDYQILQGGYKGQFEEARFNPQIQVPIYFAISNKSPLRKYKDKFHRILEDMKNDGTLENIYAKYR